MTERLMPPVLNRPSSPVAKVRILPGYCNFHHQINFDAMINKLLHPHSAFYGTFFQIFQLLL